MFQDSSQRKVTKLCGGLFCEMNFSHFNNDFCFVQCSIDVLCIIIWTCISVITLISSFYRIQGLRTFVHFFFFAGIFFRFSLNRDVHIQIIDIMSEYFDSNIRDWIEAQLNGTDWMCSRIQDSKTESKSITFECKMQWRKLDNISIEMIWKDVNKSDRLREKMKI